MNFQVGDKVIHCMYGLGEIVDFQEKVIQGIPQSCYVFEITNMQIWIAIEAHGQKTLRKPTRPEEFEKLSTILSGPPEPLPLDRVLRKNLLYGRLRDGQLASICGVVRDMFGYKRTNKLNDQEHSIMDRAVSSLLAEWTYSLGIPVQEARRSMDALLGE